MLCDPHVERAREEPHLPNPQAASPAWNPHRPGESLQTCTPTTPARPVTHRNGRHPPAFARPFPLAQKRHPVSGKGVNLASVKRGLDGRGHCIRLVGGPETVPWGRTEGCWPGAPRKGCRPGEELWQTPRVREQRAPRAAVRVRAWEMSRAGTVSASLPHLRGLWLGPAALQGAFTSARNVPSPQPSPCPRASAWLPPAALVPSDPLPTRPELQLEQPLALDPPPASPPAGCLSASDRFEAR